MRLNGRRLSGNVEDRRGASGSRIAGIGGVGGLLVMALIMWITGGNPLDVLNGDALQETVGAQQHSGGAGDDETATFVKQILAGTEDVWSARFKEIGREYEPPKLVMFTGSVQSGCGGATSSVGPFYCSADQTIYIDLSFFKQMEKEMGAGGDFAYAYVIAHEVGHHVQYLLGSLDDVHQQMSRMSKKDANKMSVRNELQADYYAGVWAHGDNEMFNSLEDGDIEEGLNAASKIGDDYLQKQAQGYAVPETFNHGRSDQRVKWLKKGLTLGTLKGGDTFSVPYSSL